MTAPSRRDPWVRAAALQCATRYQPRTPTEPEQEALAGLFWLAETFAAWIESGETE